MFDTAFRENCLSRKVLPNVIRAVVAVARDRHSDARIHVWINRINNEKAVVTVNAATPDSPRVKTESDSSKHRSSDRINSVENGSNGSKAHSQVKED